HREEIIAPAADQSLEGLGQLVKDSRTSLLLERSAALAGRGDELRSAINDLYAALASAGFAPPSLTTAGATPAVLPAADLSTVTRAALASASGPGRFDAALRLAATSLLPSGARDAVIYVGTGAVDEASFVGVTLSELGSLLANNGLRFFAVVLDQPSQALRYLAQRSGGAIYSASRPRGLGDLAADLASSPSGRYRLRFTAQADGGFGRSYLAVGVEAYLFKKSGKDELGYYAPLR
ncbi:MAG TPA: hypothetical protein VMC79_10285, partial [Rectinemataceae bacterium]|nr:hypothetical protein [Rectinemataceae bacterium]